MLFQENTLYPLLRNAHYILFSKIYLISSSQYYIYFTEINILYSTINMHIISSSRKNTLFYSYITFSDKENISPSQKYTLYTLLRSAHHIISDIHYTLFSEMHIISSSYKYTLYPLLSITSSSQKHTLYQLQRIRHYILYSEMHITHCIIFTGIHLNSFQIKTIYPLLRNTFYIH